MSSTRLGCKAADIFTGVAPVEGGFSGDWGAGFTSCEPQAPVAWLSICVTTVLLVTWQRIQLWHYLQSHSRAPRLAVNDGVAVLTGEQRRYSLRSARWLGWHTNGREACAQTVVTMAWFRRHSQRKTSARRDTSSFASLRWCRRADLVIEYSNTQSLL